MIVSKYRLSWGNSEVPAKVLRRVRSNADQHALKRALVYDSSSVVACFWPNINDPVGGGYPLIQSK